LAFLWYMQYRQSSTSVPDYNSPYDILLSKVNLEYLFITRLQNFMITLYRGLFFANYPGYLKKSSLYGVHPTIKSTVHNI